MKIERQKFLCVEKIVSAAMIRKHIKVSKRSSNNSSEDKNMNDIVTEIRNYMTRNKLSQRQLAALLGCSQPNISRWLKGEYSLRFSTYERFQKLLEEEKKGIEHD